MLSNRNEICRKKTLWHHPIEDCAFSSQGIVKFGFAVESEKWCIDKSAKKYDERLHHVESKIGSRNQASLTVRYVLI